MVIVRMLSAPLAAGARPNRAGVPHGSPAEHCEPTGREPIAGTGITAVVGGILLAGLTLYAALGGADFGGGLWDLLARGPARPEPPAS